MVSFIPSLLAAKWRSKGLFSIGSDFLCDLKAHKYGDCRKNFLRLGSVDLDKIISTGSHFEPTYTHYSREGNGTPFQYSSLENPMDGGAW